MVKKAKKKVAKKAAKKIEHGFVFIGNGDNDPANICMGNHVFQLNGRPVDIPEPFASKLRRHTHFKEV